MTEIDKDKLRVEVHTGDGKTITPGDDWTLFAGDIAIMDEDGFRSLDGPPFIARAILAMAEENRRLREALDWALSEIRCTTRYDNEQQFWNCYDIARRALGKDKA